MGYLAHYRLATWLARANGTLVTSERDALARLGSVLGLSLDQRMRAAIASRAIRDVREDDRNAVDVLALERELARQSVVAAACPTACP